MNTLHGFTIGIGAILMLALAQTVSADTIGYVAPGDRPAQDWGSITILGDKVSSEFLGNWLGKTRDHNLWTGGHSDTGHAASDAWVMWKLDASYSLTRASFWQAIPASVNDSYRDIKDYKLFVASSSVGYDAGNPADASWTQVTSGTLPHNGWMSPMTYEVPVNFTATAGQYVMLDIDSSWGDPSYVGLNEAAFNLPAPAPVTNGKYPVVYAKTSSAIFASPGYIAAASVDGQVGGANAGNYGPLMNEKANAWVMWDLGGSFSLTSASLWNWSQSGSPGRGVQDFRLYVTDDSAGFDAVANVGNGVLSPAQLGLWGLADFSGMMTNSDGVTPPEQVFAFSALGRYVLLQANTNWGGDLTGFTEVVFHGDPLLAAPKGTVILLR